MLDLFFQAQWDELYAFLAQGTPPLALQLLCLNTIVFMLWIVRRLRGARAMRRSSTIAVQSLLVFANLIIIMFGPNLASTHYPLGLP